jgi:hypothetical protein
MDELFQKRIVDTKEVDLILRYLNSFTEKHAGKRVTITDKGQKKIAEDLQRLSLNYIMPKHPKLIKFLSDNFANPQYAAIQDEIVTSLYYITRYSSDNKELLAEKEDFNTILETTIEAQEATSPYIRSLLVDILTHLPERNSTDTLMRLYRTTLGRNQDLTSKIRDILIDRNPENRIKLKEFLFQVLNTNDELFDAANHEIQALGKHAYRGNHASQGRFVVTG